MQGISMLTTGHCMLCLNDGNESITVLSNIREMVSLGFAVIIPGLS